MKEVFDYLNGVSYKDFVFSYEGAVVIREREPLQKAEADTCRFFPCDYRELPESKGLLCPAPAPPAESAAYASPLLHITSTSPCPLS